MTISLGNFLARCSRPAIAACVAYSVLCSGALLTGWGGEPVARLIGSWGSVPLLIAVVSFLWPVANDPSLPRLRRRAFQLFFAAEVLDLIATIGWSYSALNTGTTYGSWPDVIWLFYYPLATAACVYLYFSLGGRFDTLRSKLDFATVAVGFGSLLWFTALEPLSGMSASQVAQNWSAAGYGIGNAACIIAGALVAMQITNWREERALAWLLAALVATLVADQLWINAELAHSYEVGAPIDLVYHVFYLCLIMSGNAQREQPAQSMAMRGLPGTLRGSLPIVALMVGVIALLNDRLQMTDAQSPLLVTVIVISTILVVASQAIATREVVELQRQVTTSRFDERLTELVRRSSDMIAICDLKGVIRYASPSAEQLLGVTPKDLNGSRLDDVFGPESPQVRSAFDEVLREPQLERIASFSIPQPHGEKRFYKMVIANLSHVDSIRGITLNIRDVSDAARLHDQLRMLAFHDPLTMLANRTLFADRVHQAIRHVDNGVTPAVLFIDLDNFKTVNDSLGHSAGDQLLRGFAQRLSGCTRAGNTVARLGGDEFAVLIDHAPKPEAAMAVAHQVIEACREPFDIDGQAVRVGASVGVAMADRASNVERLMRNADAAMYAAKSRGKGHAELFQPEMLRAARRRIRIENELATAIEQQQFEAHYQPVVDLASRHLVGIEALVRWRHPTRGLVSPGEFIALAEETGQVVPMTKWILERACADFAKLRGGMPLADGLRVSVNVSSRYLNHGNAVAEVRTALEAHGLPPDCLVLEVTESQLLEDSGQLEQMFKQLKMLGVRLALDDFGTGYSSLAYLHRFPIDTLKIDRSFVERLVREREGIERVDAVALARAILSLAEALGLDTVAEGIETEAQREILLGLGCGTGQGYMFGRPMPIAEIFEAAVTRRRNLLADNRAAGIDGSATGRLRSI